MLALAWPIRGYNLARIRRLRRWRKLAVLQTMRCLSFRNRLHWATATAKMEHIEVGLYCGK